MRVDALVLGITLFFVFLIVLNNIFKKDINFVFAGFDAGFKLSDITLLHQLIKMGKINHPASIFWSKSALNTSMKLALAKAHAENIDQSPRFQKFLTKLYEFRTKAEIDADSHKTLTSTTSLQDGQMFRIMIKGVGLYSAHVVNVGKNLMITLPELVKGTRIRKEQWKGQRISVSFFRQYDAGYAFQSFVGAVGMFRGSLVLALPHSDKLVRIQKRKSVRAVCFFSGEVFVVTEEKDINAKKKSFGGMPCCLENISTDGALIRVLGESTDWPSTIMLRFPLHGMKIYMTGKIRGTEYDAKNDQSYLHFECTGELESQMKNTIQSYVYNVMPMNESEEPEGEKAH